MHFKKNLECCDNCHNVLITLQALKQKWDQCINIKLSDKQQEQTQQAEQQVKLRK